MTTLAPAGSGLQTLRSRPSAPHPRAPHDLLTGIETFARSQYPIRKEHPDWWRDVTRKYLSMSLPIYALRDAERPGIGKFSDLGRIYRDVLARQGIDTVVLLPPFHSTVCSPYSPVSVYALNELYVDWTLVPEGNDGLLGSLARPSNAPRWVQYDIEFERARATRLRAHREFTTRGSAVRRDRFAQFVENQRHNRNWLAEYAWFMAEKSPEGPGAPPREEIAESHMFVQWLAYNQFRNAIHEIHANGGHVIVDIPMFRACHGVDCSRHSEYFRYGHPGAGGQSWDDLSLWNWDRLRSEGFQYLLDPMAHWLDFGCDGLRVDAVANTFRRDGQSGGGDEDGESFVSGLARMFHERDALALVEVLCAPEVTEAVERHGMLALYRDWQVYSTHDFVNTDLSQDPQRFLGEVRHLLRDTGASRGWKGALFVNITFLDVEGDPFKVKQMTWRDSQPASIWETQMALPSDEDYLHRARWDRGFSLACIVSEETGRAAVRD